MAQRASYLNNLRQTVLRVSLLEKPTQETLDQVEEFMQRLEVVELFGAPYTIEDYIGKAVFYYFKGEQSLALEMINQALKKNPNHVIAWTNKSIVLGTIGRHSEALLAIDRALELDPGSAPAWTNKSGLLAILQRHQEALECAQKALALNAHNAIAAYICAFVYALRHDSDRALGHLRQAIAVDVTLKQRAREDNDFKYLWQDERFRSLTT